MKKIISESDFYSSDKIYIPAIRTTDILVLMVVSFISFVISYLFFSNSDYLFATQIFEDLDKRTNGSFTTLLSQINSSLTDYVITKSQVALFPMLLLMLIGWVLFTKQLLTTRSGLVIDKNGVTYTPILFKPKDESIKPLFLEWSDIDRLEVGKEQFTNSELLKIYVKPDFKPQANNKMEKFFIGIIDKFHTSQEPIYFEIKRLNADMKDVEKLLEKRLRSFRAKTGKYS